MQEIAGEPVSFTQSGTFTSQTEVILGRLRSALAKALSVIPGGVNKSHDIQKKLGVSFAISWQIFRLMRAEDVLEMAPHVPKHGIMSKLLIALGDAGASDESISLVKKAYSDFEQHVKTASGDRAGFDAMTSHTSTVTAARFEAAHRRSLFDSHRYVLGLEQDLFVSTCMTYPDPGHMECKQVMLSIRKGLRRLRGNGAVRISHTWAESTDAENKPCILPLDAEAAQTYGLNLLPEFSSETGLKLAHFHGPAGSVVTKWVGDGIGKANSVNIAIGSINTRAFLEPNKDGIPSTTVQTLIATPTQKFIRDVVLRKSDIGSVRFELTRWGYMAELPANASDILNADIPELACSDRIFFIGDIDAGFIPELPDYTNALKRYCGMAGWDPDDMQLFRMQLDHPILQVIHRIDCVFPEMVRKQ